MIILVIDGLDPHLYTFHKKYMPTVHEFKHKGNTETDSSLSRPGAWVSSFCAQRTKRKSNGSEGATRSSITELQYPTIFEFLHEKNYKTCAFSFESFPTDPRFNFGISYKKNVITMQNAWEEIMTEEKRKINYISKYSDKDYDLAMFSLEGMNKLLKKFSKNEKIHAAGDQIKSIMKNYDMFIRRYIEMFPNHDFLVMGTVGAPIGGFQRRFSMKFSSVELPFYYTIDLVPNLLSMYGYDMDHFNSFKERFNKEQRVGKWGECSLT